MRYLLVALLLTACGGVEAADVPPAGDIWFGSSFDTDTFELSDRSSSFAAGDSIAMVATLAESVQADELAMRWYLDGQLAGNEGANATGSGEVWGWTLAAHPPGEWRYEITDFGGNVLAAGEFTVAE